MKRQMRTALYSSVALAAMAASVPVIAQEITSTIRGTVVDASGNALANMEVTVTHDASGSRRTFTTGNNGAFLARGLRPGGPYTVVVAGNGSFQGQTISGLTLIVGQPMPLTISLAGDGASVEEIQITASRVAALRGGGASTYGSDDIAAVASTSRDIKDTLRHNPFVTIGTGDNAALSVGGANNRFNSLTVDGIRQDDDFGLNANGFPTQRSPVSVDAVEQISVAPAPFGVEFNRFTGGQINVVTKSGTNEFHGTGFYSYRDAGLAGDKSGNGDGDPTNDGVDLGVFENKFYGGTFGGPIIKDKLFFFGSYEKFQGTTPVTVGAEGSGFATEIRDVTQDDVEAIDAIASSVYGIDNMFPGDDGIAVEDEKILFKIDWNISDTQRAFASYQYTNGNSLRASDHSGSRFAYLSHWYNRSEKLKAYNFQLFSDWSDNFSTEVKVGYKENVTGQVGLALDQGIGEIQVETPDGGRVYMGIDDSRHSNALDNQTLQIKVKGEYLWNDHTFTGGYERDSVDVFNQFIQRTRGIWHFDSIEDFAAGTPDTFSYQNAVTNVAEDGAAQFELTTHTFYGQDRWDVTNELTITAGLRYDLYKQSETPAENTTVLTRTGINNTATFDGVGLWQPRFAFNYDFDDKTTIRGGAGLFSGGDPLVWMSNAFSLDGVTISSFFTRDGDLIANPNFTEVPQFAKDALAAGAGDVALIDPNFKLPSIWKFNLAVERYADLGFLGEDWHFTAEAIWARNKNAADWKELTRVQVATAADGSPIYDAGNDYVISLTNSDGGKSDVYAFSFDKSWDNGLSAFGSYTYTNSEIANEGTSSTASSNFNFAAHLDRNNRQVGTSPFERRHQIKLGVTYRKEFWDDNVTTIGAFYSGRSGRPYSITLDEFMQFGGDRSIDTGDGHLLFVPNASDTAIAGEAGADSALVVFSSAEVQADFNQLVSDFGLERGRSVDLQSERGPWVNDLDLRFSQEVPVGNFGKIELTLDLENALNFLDSDWGRVEESNFAQQALVDTRVNNATGQFTYTNVDLDPRFSFRDTDSVWKVQFGIKYKF